VLFVLNQLISVISAIIKIGELAKAWNAQVASMDTLSSIIYVQIVQNINIEKLELLTVWIVPLR